MNRKGIALVLVLTLSLGLLILGLWYISGFRQRTPLNPILWERTQMDFWGQGILQIAMLKFKKLPSEFYYAFRAASAGISSEPLNVFRCKVTSPLDSPSLSGEDVLPGLKNLNGQDIEVDFSTSFEVIFNQKFDQDGIKILVSVTTPRAERSVDHTIDAKRFRL